MEKIETISGKNKSQRKPANLGARKKVAKEALRKLSELRRELRAVDAVAMVREGRDFASRDVDR